MVARHHIAIGAVFGRWTVVGEAAPRIYKGLPKRQMNARCSCGITRAVALASLLNGSSVSCGCFNREVTTVHGGCGSRVYGIWEGMIGRCYSPSTTRWSRYGGRGITVCDRWRNSFSAFLEDMGEPSDGMTIDRINNDGNYEPGNCRWATQQEQAVNRHNTVRIETSRGRLRIDEIAKIAGVRNAVIWNRLTAGWTGDHLFLPLNGRRSKTNRRPDRSRSPVTDPSPSRASA